jgi:hypothetical protein
MALTEEARAKVLSAIAIAGRQEQPPAVVLAEQQTQDKQLDLF